MQHLLCECGNKVLCVDCTDEKCFFSGKTMSDCPRYGCNNKPMYDCEHCETVKQYQKNFREKQKSTEE